MTILREGLCFPDCSEIAGFTVIDSPLGRNDLKEHRMEIQNVMNFSDTQFIETCVTRELST